MKLDLFTVIRVTAPGQLEHHELQSSSGSVDVKQTTNGDYYYCDSDGVGYTDNGDGTWTDENGNTYTE